MEHFEYNSYQRVICAYDDWEIFEKNGKTYFRDLDDRDTHEVTLVKTIPYELAKEMTEWDLIDPDFDFDFDVAGELDDDRSYCYWKNVA